MEVAEAVELARRSIYHATFRDTASGGTVSVYHVTKVRYYVTSSIIASSRVSLPGQFTLPSALSVGCCDCTISMLAGCWEDREQSCNIAAGHDCLYAVLHPWSAVRCAGGVEEGVRR